jgi:hypothetical protein
MRRLSHPQERNQIMMDVFVVDALYSLLETEYASDLDDAAFAEAVKSQAAYLAGLSQE